MSERTPNREAAPGNESGSWKTFFDPITRILEIQLTGVIDLSVLQAMASSVTRQADTFNPLGLLTDFSAVRVELGFDEIFELPARAPEFGVTAKFPIAIVFNGKQRHEASFAEDVFTNRGYVYRTFPEKDSAAMWLREVARAGAASWKHE